MLRLRCLLQRSRGTVFALSRSYRGPSGPVAIHLQARGFVDPRAIAVIGAATSFAEKYLSTTVAKRVGFDLRHILYHHVQRLSLSFYEQRQTGDMVVRLTSDINAAEDFIPNWSPLR